ncbi:MAG: hypothetical protein M3R51_11255 [Candidatus Eremiobacteraeota bacterium]|nr:hypothetical protein [Candidatus Eremiobacteraeota bacterium]
MEFQDRGLTRSLRPGDCVILSTGATGVVRESYPQGYVGEVSIDLDGSQMTELSKTLVIPDSTPDSTADAAGGFVGESAADHSSGAKERDRRMRD